MISFPNCKINLGLRVLQKRDDGYHDIETIFFPLPFYDVLELISFGGSYLSFTTSGIAIEVQTEDNLCIKAYELLKRDFPAIPSLQLHLHKNIPAGAGLGGGSADGAFMLQLLNKRFDLGISKTDLARYALRLGSDCPFFVINQPCYATSRGEELSPVQLDLTQYIFVLINPGIMVSTGKAFSTITPAMPARSVREIINEPVATWRNELINDFEPTVFKQFPSIKNIRKELYDKGALYASLSGTGSTVYGIFEKGTVPSFSFPGNYFIKQLPGHL